MFRSLKTTGVLFLAALSIGMLAGSAALADFVLVSDYGKNAVYKYSTGGDYLGVFADSTYVTAPLGIAEDPSGNVYVSNYTAASISKFTQDGTFLETLPAVLSSPIGIGFGPDGLLYVANSGTNQTVRLDASGNLDPTWTSPVKTSTSIDRDVAFKTNGDGTFDLFSLNGFNTNRYNINGPTVTTLAQSTASAASQGMEMGSDGGLYISGQSGKVLRADVGDGSEGMAFVNFTTGTTLGVTPGTPLWVDSGNLWCADFSGVRVARFGSDGAFLGNLAAPTGGFGNPFATALITPMPEPSALILLSSALVGLLAYAWRRRK